MTDHDERDLPLLRGMLHPRMSRRGFLRTAGVGAAGLSLSGLLAACGGTDEPSPSASPAATGATGATGAVAGFDWASQEITGTFTFANWPLYIDRAKVNGEQVNPSLELFTQETDIDVHYVEAIQAYDAFFAKLRMLLEAEQPTGYDLIVMGYPKWLPLMMANDYLIPLDHSQLPNFAANAASKYQDPPYDPGNQLLDPVHVGDHRHRLRPGAHRARDHERDGPVRSGVRGAGGHVRRHRGHAEPHAAGDGRGAERVDRGRLARGGGPAHEAARRRHRPPVLRPELRQRAHVGQRRAHDGVVGRRAAAPDERLPEPEVRRPRRGRDAVDRQPLHPGQRRASARRADVHGLHLPARRRGDDRRLDPERHAGADLAGRPAAAGKPGRREPAGVPHRRRCTAGCTATACSDRANSRSGIRLFQPIFQS